MLEEFFEPIREQRRERHHENEETDGERRRSSYVAAKKEQKPGDHEADEGANRDRQIVALRGRPTANSHDPISNQRSHACEDGNNGGEREWSDPTV